MKSKAINKSVLLKQKWSLVIVGLMAVLVVSCKSRQTLATKSGANEVEFKYFKAKAKAHYSDASETVNFALNLRVCQDSAVWMLVSKGSFSAIRVMFLQNSVKYIQYYPKTDKGWGEWDYKTLSEKYGVNLTYHMVENLLLGNTVLPMSRKDKIKEGDSETSIVQQRGGFKATSTISKELNKLIQIVIEEEKSLNKVTVQYGEFIAVDDHRLPSYLDIDINKDVPSDEEGEGAVEEITIDLSYSKPEFSTSGVNFPFKVPNGYPKK